MSAAGERSAQSRAERASSFRVSFRVLPKRQREAIRAVYGFCRRADDAVDEAPDAESARAGLARAREELDAAFAGTPAGKEGERLAAALRDFALPRDPFDRLLEGVAWDLEGRRYESESDLREYCLRVASAVGHLCVRIFGLSGPGRDRYADEMGVALQWTNILRDVGKDLRRGRVYLPAETLRRHALDEADLGGSDRAARARLTSLIREQAAFARSRFARAEAALDACDRRKAIAGRIMAAVYRALLRKIERVGAGVLEREIRVSSPRRGWIALSALVGAALAPGSWRSD